MILTSRAAVLRELMPYGLVDLFLREDPAGVPGQIGQREELQVRKVERLAPPLYRLLAQVQLQAGKGEGVLRAGGSTISIPGSSARKSLILSRICSSPLVTDKISNFPTRGPPFLLTAYRSFRLHRPF